MVRRPPRSTRTDTLLPYTALFRSAVSPAASGCFRLDAEAPGYLDDPYPVFHAIRSQRPVYLAPGGVWYLSRLDDVTAVLSDGRFVRMSPAGAAHISGHSRAPTAIDRHSSRWKIRRAHVQTPVTNS